MKHPALKPLGAVALLTLVGCQSPTPIESPHLSAVQPKTKGSLGVQVLWPERSIQTIPLSTQIIRFRVLKGNEVLYTAPLTRPLDDGSAMIASTSVALDAAEDLTAEAAAYRTSPVGPDDVPIASVSVAGVRIIANQRTTVLLNMVPMSVPTLTDFSPKNGGPGVTVTLTGTFGSGGYYGLSLSGLKSFGSLTSGQIRAAVPLNATSGPLSALADGVPSVPGATFQVLKTLDLSPLAATVTLGHTQSFVAAGMDTSDVAVSSPAITRWEVIDPARLNLPGSPTSNVGTISSDGLFTAQAPGTAWVRAWSGYLSATASVTVQ